MAQKALQDYMMDWLSNLVGGAARVSDGISGTPDTRITGTCATRERITFNPPKKYVCITPRKLNATEFTAVRVVRNVSVAAADAVLGQADTKDYNLQFDVVGVGDPIEKQEFYDPDGISTIDLLVDTGTLTQVEVTGVDSV